MCCLSFFVFSQNEDDYYLPADSSSVFMNKYDFDKRTITGFSAGTMFAGGNNTGIMSSYMMPSVKYRVSNRIGLNAGLMFVYNTVSISGKQSDMPVSSFNSHHNFLIVGGEYSLNKNILLRGSIIKDLSATYGNTGVDSYLIGFDYKITEHSSVYFDFSISRHRQPFNNYISNIPFGSNNFFGNNK